MIPSRGQQKKSFLRRKGEFPFKSQRWFCLHSPNVGPRIFQWPAWMVAVMVRISSWNSCYELLVWSQEKTSWHCEKRVGNHLLHHLHHHLLHHRYHHSHSPILHAPVPVSWSQSWPFQISHKRNRDPRCPCRAEKKSSQDVTWVTFRVVRYIFVGTFPGKPFQELFGHSSHDFPGSHSV